jgi:hypothetical protein
MHNGNGKIGRKAQEQKRALAAAKRIHQPWPSYLDYENDEDFWDWYTGQHLPSPEEIFLLEMKLIDRRIEQHKEYERDGLEELSRIMFKNRS